MLIKLDKKFAQDHLPELVSLVQTIPQTHYSPETVLAEAKGERVFYGKWERSLALVENGAVVGCIMGYERQSENSEQYPTNTIYLSELAVRSDYQGRGLGKLLVQEFLHKNLVLGMQEFAETPVNFSLQTNQAIFNQKVRDFYKSFGFQKRAEKVYDDHVDDVMGWTPSHNSHT